MIYAKTGMEQLPANCMDCPKHVDLSSVDGAYCNIAGMRYTPRIGRPDWCPLAKIKTEDGNYGTA